MFFAYLIEHNRYLNIVGIVVILAIAWLLSKGRQHISIRTISIGLLLQWVIGFLMLKTALGHAIVQKAADGFSVLYHCADAGSRFIFGALAENIDTPWNFVFAIKVLPIIIFFGAFMALLFYMRIVQFFVQLIGNIIQPLLGTSGAETLCAIANSFLGQTEAPLLIRHYLHSMTKSELFVVMVSGMATISGAILAVFAAMGVPPVHLLASSVMAVPTSLVIAKIMYPESERHVVKETMRADAVSLSSNALDAIAQGTSDGLQLALNVGAMLVAFLGLLAFINFILCSGVHQVNELLVYFGYAWQFPIVTLQTIFGYLFAPFGFLLGFTGEEMFAAGALLGTKVAVNELIAYGDLMHLQVSERMVNIMTYALCGFSNFSCIGIQIGGIGALVPEKRGWLTELGFYAVIGGALSNLMSAMVAAILL